MSGSWQVGPPQSAEVTGPCDDWWAARHDQLTSAHPDLVVVLFGPWDLTDRRLDGATEFTHIGEPVYDQFLVGEMDALTADLLASGAQVVWLTGPHLNALVGGVEPENPFPESDPARVDAYNAMIRALPARHGGRVSLVDVGTWFDGLPGGELDVDERPDGVHLTEAAAVDLAYEYLGNRLVGVYRNSAD